MDQGDRKAVDSASLAGPARVVPAQVPGMNGLLGLAVGVVVIAGLFFAKDVLIPITLAILLSFVLSPVVAALRHARLPKGLAVMISVLAALGLLGGVGTLVGMQVASLADDAPGYLRTIDDKVASAKGFAADRVAFFAQDKAPPPRAAAGPPQSNVERVLASRSREPVPVRVTDREPDAFTVAGQVLGPVVGPFETFVIVLVVAIFILMQKEDLRDRMIRLFGSSDLHRTTLAMDDAGARLSKYFLSQLAVNTSFGIVIGTGLWAIGVPVPALWGILAGILRFVPYVGALLGAALPLALAAGVDPGWTMVIEVAVLFAVVEPLIGYVVEPLLYGHSTGLSPLSVILAAVFWTWIWGPVGLVLSMPLTLCLVVLGRHVPALEFLDILLGDRPALTPVESFYQRMLAADPEEALEQAELLLKDRSLASYYDEVALGGLKLAAEDARRGVVDRAGAERIVHAMSTVVDELSEQDDGLLAAAPVAKTLNPMPAADTTGMVVPASGTTQAPDDWRESHAVTCIAGRGVLDDAVTAMLAQLLARRGFGTRRIPHAAVARDAVQRVDYSGTRMICLSYLEIGGSPSHLRYLVRRLRREAPGAHILVGLWPQGEAALSDEQIQRVLGADSYVGSLASAVDVVTDIATAPDISQAA
ncbi:AI-2E family transporter [Sphingomonas sp. Leaf37]|uniref:AI-2E family transporter n=1 Tax=Sphingomonas sp. Leaf37 TaxID=2876552 RepID=UPI001E52514D|nr:AI-2E family transporter [Sphingomonas sp. Leaf37]